MLKKGTFILSAWALINALPGIASLILIFTGHHAPAFQILFQPNELISLDSRAIHTVDGLAIIANTLIISYCALFYLITQKCLSKGYKWAFYSLAFSTVLIQIASYLSDQQFAGKNVWIVHGSTAILVVGFSLCSLGLFDSAVKSET